MVRPSGETRFSLAGGEIAVDPGDPRVLFQRGENGLGAGLVGGIVDGKGVVGEDGDDDGLVEDALFFKYFEGTLGLGILFPEARSQHGLDPRGQECAAQKDHGPEGNDQPAMAVDPAAQTIEMGSVDIAGQCVTSGKPSLGRL